MGKDTKIGWTHHTFNMVIGCAKIAPGCANCYAADDMDRRRGRAKWGPNGTRVLTSDSYWQQPLAWNSAAEEAGERRRVFCSSLADVFEDWQGPIERNRWVRPKLEPAHLERKRVYISDTNPDSYSEGEHPDSSAPSLHAEGGFRPATMSDVRASLFRLIDRTPWLDWLLLTKRPENIRALIPSRSTPHPKQNPNGLNPAVLDWHRPNVWLGTSVSEQETVDRNVPELLKAGDLAPVLFLSYEPALGPIDLEYPKTLWPNGPEYCCPGISNQCGCGGGPTEPPLVWGAYDRSIRWVICGAESGPGRRPMDLKWAHDLNSQCKRLNIPVFNKQYVINDQLVTDAGRFPLALRAQDFPAVSE